MYSNRYIALHCCQGKYIDEIKLNGIVKDTKAIFICDLNKIDSSELYNTLLVLIYHGIGVSGWTRIIEEKENLRKIDENLIIAMAKISKEQENIINENKILNYYKICNKSEKTMNYCKIKNIGKIDNIVTIEKIPLYDFKKQNPGKVDPIKDRFFIKNTYNDLKLQNNEIVKEIEEVCHKIANSVFELIENDIELIKNLNERY